MISRLNLRVILSAVGRLGGVFLGFGRVERPMQKQTRKKHPNPGEQVPPVRPSPPPFGWLGGMPAGALTMKQIPFKPTAGQATIRRLLAKG